MDLRVSSAPTSAAASVFRLNCARTRAAGREFREAGTSRRPRGNGRHLLLPLLHESTGGRARRNFPSGSRRLEPSAADAGLNFMRETPMPMKLLVGIITTLLFISTAHADGIELPFQGGQLQVAGT